MEILISVIAKITEYTIEPIGHELGYLCFIHKNFQELKKQVEVLKAMRESVQDKVRTATRNVEVIKPVVEKWLREIDDIIGKSEVILANEGGHGRLCSRNLIQQYKISRKARKMVDEVHEMKNEGENFEMVSYRAVLSSELSKVLDFLYFESRKSTMEQIINALSDVNVHRIGVHGMGGIGKTMLVQEIVRKIVKNKSFDEVAISSISQTLDIKNIQGELADKLDLKFEQETIKGRALKLQKRLKNEKSILIVLDDVWEPIDLETIGIPSVEDHTGCKLLFTTRDRHLISEMGADQSFEINFLGNDESWNLFKAMAGEIVERCDLKPIAIQIVRECAKLPIAITTVAKALKHKPFSSWNDALDQLKRDDMVANIREMNKKVYLPLKLSYDYLENEEAKLLFLLCSMFREDLDIHVEELLIYAMGLGFLQGVDTVAQGRHRIKNLIDDLISSSLLLQSEFKNNYVKMHDMVRDVSISIASKHDYIRTLTYVKRCNDELKQEKLLGNHTVVSFILEGLRDPLPKLMLPKVQLFTLDGSRSFHSYVLMVENFFEEMKELKGLDLCHAEISLLPPSLYSFANIRLLRLRYCKFGNIDMIGELKKVEILDFSGSNIAQLPTTICQLTQLKVLNLNECGELKVIPPNILSKLTKLEELNLKTFDRWEGEEWYEGRKNASLSELRYLPKLCVLDLTIQDEEIMPKHLFSGELNLEKFQISIGFDRVDNCFHGRYDILRKLNLKIESQNYLDDWMKKLVRKTKNVCLKGSICSKVLHMKLDANDFLHLQHLGLYDNLELQHLIHEKNKTLGKCLSKLECLCLRQLENLESIINGYDGESTFNKLREVTVRNCYKLETLFFNCNMDDVLNLERIDINGCMKMEVLISVIEDEEATNHIEFTYLQTLYLRRLPRLQKFYSKKEKYRELSCDNSERSAIKNDIEDSFFTDEVSLPNLGALDIEDANNLKMIWSNVLIPNSFSKLEEVKISSCNNLEKVFPPNMKSLHASLNSLRISSCEKIEAMIIVMENEEATNHIEFTHLETLYLSRLPRLQKFCSKKEKCRELSCDNSKRSAIKNDIEDSFFTDEVSLPNLETLEIDDANNLKMIWSNVLIPNSFSKLKEVKISSCNNLEKVFPPNMKSLHASLNSLRIRSCEKIEAMIIVMENEEATNHIEFTHLKSLYLRRLPRLQKFCSKKEKCKELSCDNSERSAIKNDIEDSFFTDKVSLPNLGTLEINDANNLKMIWSNVLIPNSFSKLKEVEISSCNNLEKVFPPNMKSLHASLNSLRISSCEKIEAMIIVMENEEATNHIEFTYLQSLSLRRLPRLQKFCSKKEKCRELSCDNSERSAIKIEIEDSFFTDEVSLPNLGTLEINDANNLKMIWSNVLIPNSFSKLKEVEISSCNNLEKVFPPNMKSLHASLNSLRISSCEKIEAMIIVMENEEATNHIEFTYLQSLSLRRLPRLQKFCSKKEKCRELSCDNSERSAIKIEIEDSFFTDEVSLPNLGALDIEDANNLKMIWSNVLIPNSFSKLEEVKISSCNNLEKVFPPNMKSLHASLNSLIISSCEKIEAMIIVMENEEATNHIEFTHLQTLYLRRLPRLQKFCSKKEKCRELSCDNSERSAIKNDIEDSFFTDEVSLPNLEELVIDDANNLKMIWSNVLIPNSFSKLKEVEISSCNNLEKVFSPNMMSTLLCLHVLKIEDCEVLKGIFEVQEPITVTETANLIVLQNLRSLTLYNLPSLEYVWNKNPCELMSFVNIKKLSIKKCSKLKREYSVKTLKEVEELSIDIRQLKKALEKEEIADDMLESKRMETSKVEVTQLQGDSELFSKLKNLELYGFLDYISTHLPMKIVQILYQLERFEFKEAFIEEIFPIEILIPMKKLEVLILSKLPKLRHLLKECSQKNTSVFKGLGHLNISECGALNSLVPSSVSFTNLGTLEVDRCHSLTHLLSTSVARTLVHLSYLKLEECKRMTTVIEGGVEEGNDEIVLKKLESLFLDSFSKLTSFYSGRGIIKLPCLNSVSIYECPEMKVFSFGIVSTPNLKLGHVDFDDDNIYYSPKDFEEMIVQDINVIVQENWENNIDTRIPYLFEEQTLEENQCEDSCSDAEE